jgi:acyl-CoA synthetase (AMP-forming)/AMP-acid ligase II
MGWNFADTWEHNADRFGDLLALAQGDREITWAEMDRRADGIAATLHAAGLGQGAKVAQYMYTCPEYIESMFGLFKAGFAPVNTNYRYTDDELAYLWENADAEAVVFHGTFTPRCAALRDRLPGIHVWLWVDDGSEPCPSWATPYETAAAAGNGRFVAPWGRSGDDLFILYTGGTTGMPKGVMWRQDDLLISLDSGSRRPLPDTPGWDEFDDRFPRPGPRHLPGAPMMHGTGAFGAMWGLVIGGSVVMTPGRHFDAVEMLDTIANKRINGMTMVGDAFGKPLLAALDAEPDRWDISSLRFIMSSGAMFSSATKHGLLRHNPRLLMVDSLGSSEAIGMANDTFDASVAAGGGSATARFQLGPNTKVITEDGREVQPGSGEAGRVARRGRAPLGYYKDAAKSATTFVEINGERWTIPGDFAEVEADGTLRLLGRGSQCINTGGEKVYPEEVEEALKLHPAVRDAAVVGVPDDRFGEAITAIVELDESQHLDEAALIAHVKGAIASYKAPRHVIAVATIGRAANGKLDYKRLKAEAITALN